MPSSFGDVGFDKKDVTADRRPRQTDDNTGPLYALLDFFLELKFRCTQQLSHDFRRYDEPGLPSFQQAACMFSRDAGDLAFEVADTGFAGVVAHDVMQRRVFEVNLVGLQAAVLAAAWHEVITRNLHLLLFGVPREFDDFHAIAQRGWNRIQNVGGRDEEDTG